MKMHFVLLLIYEMKRSFLYYDNFFLTNNSSFYIYSLRPAKIKTIVKQIRLLMLLIINEMWTLNNRNKKKKEFALYHYRGYAMDYVQSVKSNQ